MLTGTLQKFILDHFNDDLPRLLLSAHRYPGIPVREAVAQIEALRKIRTKIPSWFRFDLNCPPLLSVEQASSEQTARFKAGLFSGKRMADLTGGMGVDAYFYAQHFDRVFYVEQNPELAVRARHNFAVLGATNIDVAAEEAEVFLQHHTEPFDLLYLDPARRDGRQRRVFRLDDCQPNILSIKELLLKRASKVLIKTAPLLDLHQAAEQLGAVSHIWVVSVDNEVREVLYLLEKPASGALPSHPDIPVEAVSLGLSVRTFVFTRADEQAATPDYSTPLRYLYEPDAAILKAGAFRIFARRFGLAKLHPNTHLYTSERLVADIPARVFAIDAVLKYERKAVGAAIPSGRANVAARNFPDSVEAMRKKLALADGGDVYMFGATDIDGPKLVVGRKAENGRNQEI